mmetsp:Transcript_21875/g.33414  ORF Transcript_21875/g.33414 Transcript_21875/m.33414 type:complete len:85 (-) Transcript_21875:330-584(-)
MKSFVSACSKKSMPDNFLNNQKNMPNEFLDGGLEGLHPPKIVASHIYNSGTLSKLAINPPFGNLLMYLHKNERKRLVSANKQIG